MNEMTSEQKEQALFTALIYSLHASGMQQMGKIANPMSGKVERDLAQAQYTIDMLDMLKHRTEGNRTENESKLLKHVLAELQMNYVDEVKLDRKKAAEASAQESDKSAGGESEGEDAKKGGTPEETGGKTETERSAN